MTIRQQAAELFLTEGQTERQT